MYKVIAANRSSNTRIGEYLNNNIWKNILVKF